MPSLPMSCCLLALSVACAPAELSTPSTDNVSEILEQTFPSAGGDVQVIEVEREGDVARAQADFRGADVTVLLEAGDADWEITGAEMGQHTYSVEELQGIGQTMITMDALADALAAYHAANGAYPMLDDQVGLQELVPGHYAADAALTDGWGHPLRYRLQGQEYTLTSVGPDGQPGTADDLFLVIGPER